MSILQEIMKRTRLFVPIMTVIFKLAGLIPLAEITELLLLIEYMRHLTDISVTILRPISVLDVPTRGGSGASGTWGISITGNATSETLSTVTSRGATTGSQITVSTSNSGSMYTGIKAGSGYSDGVSGATFRSITDHPSGGSFGFATYYGGSSGTNSFYVSSSGSGYFKETLSINQTTPVAKLVVNNEGTINTTTPGLNVYNLHLSPGAGTTDYATGITFGANTGSGNNAQAGIYVQYAGSYGTKMYLATTDSFASGSKTAISIDHSGNVNVVRGALTQGGNQVLHAGNYTSYTAHIGNGTLTLNTNSGAGLTGTASFSANQSGATTFTVTSNATSANTAGAIVQRGGSGEIYLTNIYNSGWFRNQNSGEGVYNTTNDTHFVSAGNRYWHFNTRNGSTQTSGGLVLYNQFQSTEDVATGRKGALIWNADGFGLVNGEIGQ
jgi:hypothetical protein